MAMKGSGRRVALLLVATAAVLVRGGESTTEEGKLIRLPGDIILGGIFPMHEAVSKDSKPCCMPWTRSTQTTSFSLGSLILDSCSSDTYALEQSMEFFRSYMNQVHELTTSSPRAHRSHHFTVNHLESAEWITSARASPDGNVSGQKLKLGVREPLTWDQKRGEVNTHEIILTPYVVPSLIQGKYLRYYSSKYPFKPGPCKSDPCEPHLYKPNFSKPNYGKSDPCKPGSCKPDPCKPDPCKPDPCKLDPCKPNPCQSKSCQPRQLDLKKDGKGRFAHCKDAVKPPCPSKPVKKDGKKNLILLIGLATILAAIYVLWKMGFFDSTPEPEVPQKKSMPRKDVKKIPSDSSEIPTCVPYLLIGGGTASLSAFRAIREKDPKAQILVVSNEVDLPYMRPPLSKELWFTEDMEAVENLKFKQWNGSEKSIFFKTEDFYVNCKDLLSQKNGGVAVARGWTVVKIDTIEQKVCLDDGHSIEYGRCLVATGGTPKSLPVIDRAPKEVQDKVILYRDISDFKDLDCVTKEAKSITILGGGFLGSELACALAKRGKGTGMQVTQILPEKGNMGKILPHYLSVWTTDKVRSEGVEVMAEAHLTGIDNEQDQLVLSLSNGKKIKTDRVVVAVGIEPNTDLAQESGLEIDKECGGFLVNAELMARTNLWVAGDCSCFYDVKFGRRRVEHHDNAIVSGRLAGENMTGAGKPYMHQSMFWSDLGPNVGYEAVGIVDSCLPTVGVFAKATEKDTLKAAATETGDAIRSETEMCAKPSDASGKPSVASVKPTKEEVNYGKGIVFYLRDGVVVGILLWNLFNRMDVARQVLQDDKKYEDLDEVSKLFNIHETET